MKKDRWLLRAVVLLALSAALMSGVSLAAEAGSPQDPLVTLSYLNDTFFSQLMQRVDQRIAERTGQALPGGGASASFVVVTLNEGQTLTGGVGCEVMLRVGSATCGASDSVGLIDTTSGGVLGTGAALSQNHLYMVTIAPRWITASSATVKVLVRGPYTIQ